MSVQVRTRREKQPEARKAVERIMKMSRVIEMPDEADIYDELLEDIQDNWEESSRCDIDQYDVARAVRKLHSSGIVRMRHRDPVTGESVHRLQIGGVSNS